MEEQVTLNHPVRGSSPLRLTLKLKTAWRTKMSHVRPGDYTTGALVGRSWARPGDCLEKPGRAQGIGGASSSIFVELVK